MAFPESCFSGRGVTLPVRDDEKGSADCFAFGVGGGIERLRGG
jgi:hypothetical protein